MTDSISDLLGAKNYSEPKEIQIIKDFVHNNFNSPCSVTIQQRTIVIAVKGSALAGSLRLRLHELQEICKTDKRLMIRIG